AALGAPNRPRGDFDPMLRSLGPDIAVFDVVVAAGCDGQIKHLETSRPIIGMNRRQQILIGNGLARLASEKRLAGIGGFELELRKMQFERPEMAAVERGL